METFPELLYNKSMATQTFFSVIIPTFNRKGFLEPAVNSVLDQTFADLELIIIDDGSDDGTRDLIPSYNDTRITYCYQKNNGVAAARNSGLNKAKGKFIAFLDSDDRWTPEKLQRSSEYILKYPEIAIFHTEEIWYRSERLLPQKKKHKKPCGLVYEQALPLCCISISTAVIKRTVFDHIGMFDEKFEACEDYDFWLRATSKYRVKLIPEELTVKDGGRPDQLSSRIWGLDRFRIMSLEKMLLSGGLSGKNRDLTFKELVKKCSIFSDGSKKRGKAEESEYYATLPDKYKR